jgi:hypothetical protein
VICALFCALPFGGTEKHHNRNAHIPRRCSPGRRRKTLRESINKTFRKRGEQQQTLSCLEFLVSRVCFLRLFCCPGDCEVLFSAHFASPRLEAYGFGDINFCLTPSLLSARTRRVDFIDINGSARMLQSANCVPNAPEPRRASSLGNIFPGAGVIFRTNLRLRQ